MRGRTEYLGIVGRADFGLNISWSYLIFILRNLNYFTDAGGLSERAIRHHIGIFSPLRRIRWWKFSQAIWVNQKYIFSDFQAGMR